MVFAVRLNECEGCEAGDDLRSGLGWTEALQQFLQDEARRDDHTRAGECVLEGGNFRLGCRRIPAQRQGPDACVDEQGHLRDRSAL